MTEIEKVAALLRQEEQSEQEGRLERARAVLRAVEAKQNMRLTVERNVEEKILGAHSYGVFHVPPTVEGVLDALATTMKLPGWVAVVALPDIGWEAAAKRGVDTCRVALIPDLKDETHRVLGALVEGFETIVLGNVSVAAPQQRALAARCRKLNRTILTMIPWQTISKPFALGTWSKQKEPVPKLSSKMASDVSHDLETIKGSIAI